MNKKAFIILGIIIVLIVAWYLLSPIWRNVERNDSSPLIGDQFESMDQATRMEFEKQTQEMQKMSMEKTTASPTGAQLLAKAPFVARAHDVSGEVLLIEDNGKKILRFENFETINGPDLRIYLSADLSNNDIVDLGPIEATKGSINYELPEGVDTDKYSKVLVWCRAFRVLFSYAE